VIVRFVHVWRSCGDVCERAFEPGQVHPADMEMIVWCDLSGRPCRSLCRAGGSPRNTALPPTLTQNSLSEAFPEGDVAQALYAFADSQARSMGGTEFRSAGPPVSDFPHAAIYTGSLAEFDASPSAMRWILEIHVRHCRVRRLSTTTDPCCLGD
jgi:hypothetical protein